MPTKDSELVNSFLKDFTNQLTKKYKEEIDFILLFGSAARGEFKAGISDVDLIIQVKKKALVSKVENFAEKIFWALDTKHKTQLAKVCSTKREGLFSLLEKEVKLYKPFEVLGPDDIKWEEGKITSPGLGAFAIIAPIHQFAKKVKSEGKILYGRNILDEIKIEEHFFENIKAITLPYVLSIFAVPVSIILPDKGLKYSLKAVLYSVDNQISVLDAHHARTASLNMKILRAELGNMYSIRLAREAIHAKRNFNRIKKDWSYIDKVAFCAQAPIYIFYNNVLSIISCLRNS
jgi:predicted nucleotidyltransferase